MEKSNNNVKLTYLGNSCVMVTSPKGIRIVSDPYGEEIPDGLTELPADLTAEAVTVSHIHADHNNVAAVKGNPQVLTEPGIVHVGDIKVSAFLGWEGSPHGPNPNMRNIVFMFETAGVKILQLGDSGIITEPNILKAVENADVVIVNIDGYVIADPEVMPFMKQIKARTVLLAHYTLEGKEIWNGAPTTKEFIANFAPGFKVLQTSSEMVIVAGMPEQIALPEPLTLIKK
jgi:L-ascorbate metabolism protein UlaG (beta-lactamase superfamily)